MNRISREEERGIPGHSSGGKENDQNVFERICKANIAKVENIPRDPIEIRKKMLFWDRLLKSLNTWMRSQCIREYHCRVFGSEVKR